MTEEFDYIIVGGGSAGSVLANRLSASGRDTVLLLEAGGTDRHPWVKLPIGYGKAFHDPRINWRYMAEGSDGLGGRQMYWPRGKVLGGSSSINGLVWMRGLPSDFDDWEEAGNPGWGWDHVAPVFDRVEAVGGGRSSSEGQINVAMRAAEYHPIGQNYVAATRAEGLPQAPVEQSHYHEGIAPYRITTRKGMRHSAADAFMRPAMRRANLAVKTRVEVDRLGFEARCAKTVHYRRGATCFTARARRMIVLSAGAVGSPAILQRSGIGPAKLLAQFGITVVQPNEAVGGGLQDHLGVDYYFKTNHPTLNQVLGTWRGRALAALRFAFTGGGPLSLSVNQMGGLVRSAAEAARPDLQLYFTPLSYTAVQRRSRPLLQPDPWPGFAIGFNPCRPTSAGRVDICSADLREAPRIAPNYVATEADAALAVAGGRMIERLLATAPLADLITAQNGFAPGGASDADILADFRARASTVFHPCGTCRMAPEASAGVVDPSLRVHGVDGLRVVDASVFPNITSANTNAPTIMLAAKAADIILAQ